MLQRDKKLSGITPGKSLIKPGASQKDDDAKRKADELLGNIEAALATPDLGQLQLQKMEGGFDQEVESLVRAEEMEEEDDCQCCGCK